MKIFIKIILGLIAAISLAFYVISLFKFFFSLFQDASSFRTSLIAFVFAICFTLLTFAEFEDYWKIFILFSIALIILFFIFKFFSATYIFIILVMLLFGLARSYGWY